MSTIYYKNSQTQNFIPLTYQDIGAASVTHTHTFKDIIASPAQKLDISNGGANIVNNNNNVNAGIYAAKADMSHIQAVPVNNGVFGYYNKSNNYPSFQLWPTIAGGTGCSNALDTALKFNIFKTNDKTPYVLNLNYHHIVDAFNTNSTRTISATIYLPFQLLTGTVVSLSLYPWILQQPSINTSSYPNSKYLCGFSDISFIVGTETTIEDCIFYYGHNGYGNTDAGLVVPTEPKGKVKIYSAGGGPIFDNNQQLLYYQTGHIIQFDMIFATDIALTDTAIKFGNNRPISLILNRGLKTLTNQLVIPSINSITSPTDEESQNEGEDING